LTWPIFAPVERAFGTAPNILAHPAVNFIFGFRALCHRVSSCKLRRQKDTDVVNAQGVAREYRGGPQAKGGERALRCEASNKGHADRLISSHEGISMKEAPRVRLRRAGPAAKSRRS